MKKILRFAWIIAIISYVILKLMPEQIFYNAVGLSVALITMGALSSLAIAICLFSHWLKSQFENRFFKIFWIVALLLFPFYLIGPVSYWLFVIELGKTLKITKNQHTSESAAFN